MIRVVVDFETDDRLDPPPGKDEVDDVTDVKTLFEPFPMLLIDCRIIANGSAIEPPPNPPPPP